MVYDTHTMTLHQDKFSFPNDVVQLGSDQYNTLNYKENVHLKSLF